MGAGQVGCKILPKVKQFKTSKGLLPVFFKIAVVPRKLNTSALDTLRSYFFMENHNHDHSHAHGGIFGEKTELIFSLTCGVFLAAGFGLSFVPSVPHWVVLTLYLGAYLFGGYFTAKEAITETLKGNFEIDFLMLVAAIGAGFLGEWAEGALLLFLFSLGHALEHYSMNRARKSIAALADLTPPTAIVLRNGEQVEVKIESLQVGDLVLVKPNTKIPADGMVVRGNSSVDQSPITGESIPVGKHAVEDEDLEVEIDKLPAENRVFAGTINGGNSLVIKVLRLTEDSTLSRLIQLVKEAETQRSPTQQFTDQVEKYYVPGVLILVVTLLFAFLLIDETFSESFYRAMAVLVAASPCALAISTPSAVLAGVARAAREGVLIKGGRPLEDLGELTAVAFDKTGTLTEGKPKLTNAIPFGETSKAELLRTAVAVEALSDHPLAAAIVAGGKSELAENDLPEAEKLEALTARGVRAKFQSKTVHIGNRRLLEELNGAPIPPTLNEQMERLEDSGHTAMIVHAGKHYLGILSVMDVARPEAKVTLERLRRIGIKRMIMLTGDNQKVADSIAAAIGITDPLGGLLPEDKVSSIEKLKKTEGKVAMVGDGVNDAPAMAKSTVGIAMGAAGSDVALETADIALMADRLDNLPFAIALSRKANQIIRQNLWVSLGMVAVLVPMTMLGVVSMGPAVVGHEGSTLVVVLNALRLLGFRMK